jgi:hypothetical protein
VSEDGSELRLVDGDASVVEVRAEHRDVLDVPGSAAGESDD